jgi:hypothetical protein
LTDTERLRRALEEYLAARGALVRTPDLDPSLPLRSARRDEAHDDFLTLLTLHGAVFHHAGYAYWVERGEVRTGQVLSHTARKGATKR